jgi:hypothetical protein
MTGTVATAHSDLHASPERVWAALAEPDQISAYSGGSRVQTTWQVASSITWSGGCAGRTYEDKGEVRTYDEPHVLSVKGLLVPLERYLFRNPWQTAEARRRCTVPSQLVRRESTTVYQMDFCFGSAGRFLGDRRVASPPPSGASAMSPTRRARRAYRIARYVTVLARGGWG